MRRMDVTILNKDHTREKVTKKISNTFDELNKNNE